MERASNKTPFLSPSSSLRAGVSLSVQDFLAAKPFKIAETLLRYVEELSGRARGHEAEIDSWNSGVPALQYLLSEPRLIHLRILLEASLPNGLGRIDCTLIGSDSDGRAKLIILELKAWSDARRVGDSNLLTPIPSGRRGTERLTHPSDQANTYETHLRNLVTECQDQSRVVVSSASWLYNVDSSRRAPFDDPIFAETLKSSPIFGGGEIDELRSHIFALAPLSSAGDFLVRLDVSAIAPSRSLMERLSSNLETYTGFDLTEDQLDVFNRIIGAYDPNDRRVIVVKGGPGSGKTVLALQLLKAFYKKSIPAFYFASSRAIVNAYRNAFQDASSVFANSISLGKSSLPVQIIDEAHRLRGRPAIRKAIEASPLTIFLVDDRQVILPADIKNSRDITQSALAVGPRAALELELSGNKRSGSEAYINWLDDALGIAGADAKPKLGAYRFEIVETPNEIETRLRELSESWRIVGGICWPWSDPTESGEMPNDIVIPEHNFSRPWIGDYKKLIGTPFHKAALYWATEVAAQPYVGNIYTAQSFEFEYIGVIFGSDLVVRNGRWKADIDRHPKSDVGFFAEGAWKRPSRARDCFQHIYRVLLTRGRKGCVVYFQDSETRTHFERLLGVHSSLT